MVRHVFLHDARRCVSASLFFFTMLFMSACGGAGGTPSTPAGPSNPQPAITSLSPASLTAGAAGATITINGSNFIQSSTAEWNQSSRTTTFVSSSQVQMAVTAADIAAGSTAQILVVNPAPGGGASSAATFTVNNPSPVLASVSPANVTMLSVGTVVTLTGTGFVPTSTVTWNGVSHASTVVSSTQIQLTLTAADVASVGSPQIAVINPVPGGGSAPPTSLAVVNPAPAIAALSPGNVQAGGPPLTLTVNGTGFVTSSTVQVNGVARPTIFVNSNVLTTQISASDIAAPGTLQVAVITGAPGGGTSAPAVLTIANFVTPSIVSLTPNSVTIGSPNTVIDVMGAGFTAASTVQINGGSPITPNSWSPNELFFTLPAADSATLSNLSVTVSNPGPITSTAATISVVPNPVPAITLISPSSAAVGGPDFTLTVSGSGFVPTSVVQWNGSALATTLVNSTQLTATVPAHDIDSFSFSNVTVSNPSPGGGVSAAIPFTTYLALPANYLIYNPSTQLLYASVASSAGPGIGNSIVSIDPYTGAFGKPIFVGSEPGPMALSSDGGTIWVGLNGAGAVRQVNLQTQTAGLQFSLGGGTGIYNPPEIAKALAVMPGHANTVAVSVPTAFTYSSVVTIYDSGVARTNAQNSNMSCCSGVLGLTFDSTGTVLYEAGSGYGSATVATSGITASTILNANVSSNDLRVDGGHAYLTTGVILDANTGTQLGVFSSAPNQIASGPVVPDSTLGEAFVLTTSPTQGYELNAYDTSTFVLNGSLPVPGVNFVTQSPTALTRWGLDGLAFTTGAQVFILRSSLVRDLSKSLADLSITASSGPNATTGTNFTYNLTISNAGPQAATPATVTDTLPDGVTLQSVASSQGNCSGASIVLCDLGNLNSGASATVQITVTPLSPGTISNTAVVSAPQADPNPVNNTVVSSTVVTGSIYNAAPVMTSINPEFVQAGSGLLTLTVNGAGFASNSTVQFNSAPLPTTFVSSSQLTATVDASKTAALGWGWINVSTPANGGGTSASLPLTVYQVANLDVNHFQFDPFTRKLYATVPSTATQLTGNSLVAIDPTSGSLSAPLPLGSEPNRLAESSDGKYLYVGLDGSQSLTRVDLTSMTQGPVYPLLLPATTPPTQFAARDLEVAPGNDNLLAVDAGSWAGDGLLDISGSTATMRPHMTGPYTGSNLAFANSSTVYSYDIDTTGAGFYVWSVATTGLTLNNNTEYTLNGIGGFAGGFELANGIVYGFSGGVANPSTTPPTQLGQFQIYNAGGNTLEGSSVAADPALGRVFYLGENIAGSAYPVLLSYDQNKFVLLDSSTFPGSPSGLDLVRWGRDGLAWHSSLGYPFGGTAGTGQIFLMRGPFVLPQWYTANPTPTASSVSPSSATAASGNLVLTVTGSSFVPGAIVLWNGAERATTFVDAAHLTVAIPAADLAKAGTANISVNNPGTNNSGTISFTIN